MERIEGSEIGPLWKEHFPLRHQMAASLTLVFALMLIVAAESRALAQDRQRARQV